MQRFRAGIIARVRTGMEICFLERLAHGLQPHFGVPATGGRQVAHLDHRRTQGALIAALAAQNIIRRNSPLPIGRPRQRNGGWPAENGVHNRDDITHRKNIGIAGRQMRIRHNVPLRPNLQPGVLRQRGVGAHPHAKHHHIRGPGAPILDRRLNTPAHLGGKSRHRGAQLHDNAGHPQFFGQQRTHFHIHGRQQLPPHFQQRHLQAAMPQTFRQLHPHEAPAHHNGALRASIQLFGDAVHILKRPQMEHFRQINPRQRKLHRQRPGGNHQSVIRLLALGAAHPVQHAHRLFLAIYRQRLMIHADIHIEPRAEILRRHDQQPVPLRNDFAKVIWQTAVGVRNVRAFFEQDDFVLLIHSAQTSRRTGPAGHATNNDCLHANSLGLMRDSIPFFIHFATSAAHPVPPPKAESQRRRDTRLRPAIRRAWPGWRQRWRRVRPALLLAGDPCTAPCRASRPSGWESGR